MEDHGGKDQEHTKYNSCYEYGIDIAKSGHQHHRLCGVEPERRDHIFKSEDAAEHQSEESGEDPGSPDDGGKVHFLFPVKEKTAHSQQQPLPKVSEHGAEDKGIGQRHKDGGIHFMVIRKPVHLDIHLKGLEDPGVFQFGGRIAADPVLIVLHHHKEIGVFLHIL